MALAPNLYPKPAKQVDAIPTFPIDPTSGMALQTGRPQAPYPYQPLGFQQITNLSSPVGLTVPSGTVIAFVYTEGAGVRWRDDGSAPTASIGMPLPAGSIMTYSGVVLAALQFIQMASNAILNVSYYA